MNDATRDTYLQLGAFADELARGEVAAVCTSPGSRSLPLVATLTATPGLRCLSHIDERSAGFFAVGLARATGRPVALVCTSGTAAANYLPAIVEAYEARLPLLVLTADRPPELRAAGAGQTIDQLKLYGSSVRWFQEIDAGPATAERLRWIRRLACRALAESTAGPVHLNFPLREPLVDREAQAAPVPAGRTGTAPFVATSAGRDESAALERWLDGRERGVIVAGESRGLDAAALGETLAWPVLADPLSGARRGTAAVAHYDLLLRGEMPAPGAVLRVGALPTSKPLRQWLGRLDCPQAMAVPGDDWPDPSGRCSARFVTGRLPRPAPRPDDGWLAAWRAEDARAAAAVEALLGDALSEPQIARVVAAGRRPLVVAASMPIRDLESFAPLGSAAVIANRGANGIDGTIATAYGVAAAGAPATLLTGDVAFAHDAGALLTGTRLRLPLTIVLVDNGGGGIFDFLAAPAIGAAYEEHVATPPGLAIEPLAAAYGARYRPIGTCAELRAALAEPPDGTLILHCRTDRAANVALHRRLAAAVNG